MDGKVTTIIPLDPVTKKGGFGFIRDSEGHDRFFHARDLINFTGEAVPDTLAELTIGTNVEFEPTAGNKSRVGGGNGLRAVRVWVVA